MKIKCYKCGRTQDETLFVWKIKERGIRSHLCRSCHHTYTQDHYRKNHDYYIARNRRAKARWLTLIREAKNKPCMDCGGVFPYYVMDFDHSRGKKKTDVARVVNLGPSAIRREIEKCDLVCSNCHRIRTHKRRAKEKTG